MIDQFLYGYRLSASDGSVSRWSFFNRNDHISLAIKLKNGVLYTFIDEARALPNWAAVRELNWECVVYQFYPDDMKFSLKE